VAAGFWRDHLTRSAAVATGESGGTLSAEMSKDRAGDALFGEDHFAVHRNGSAPVSQPSERFAVPLWRAVLRYWVGVLIVCVVGWNRASGHAGAGGTWLLPLLAMVGGIAALAIAWLSKLRTPDRRLLYSAWGASAIVAVFVAWLLRFRSDVAIPVVAGAMFAAFVATVARLRAGR